MPVRIRLDGQKLIAAKLQLSVRQVRKLASSKTHENLRLPVFKMTPDKGKNAKMYAFLDDLEEWLARRSPFRR